MDKVHKPVTTQLYTPSSKPFGIYLSISCFVNSPHSRNMIKSYEHIKYIEIFCQKPPKIRTKLVREQHLPYYTFRPPRSPSALQKHLNSNNNKILHRTLNNFPQWNTRTQNHPKIWINNVCNVQLKVCDHTAPNIYQYHEISKENTGTRFHTLLSSVKEFLEDSCICTPERQQWICAVCMPRRACQYPSIFLRPLRRIARCICC
jgi:hypothetical protein